MTDKERNAATAKRLQQALNKSGLTQQELADSSQVSKSLISQYLHGKGSPKPETAQKLAAVLHVDSAWLMGMRIDTTDTNLEKFLLNYNDLPIREKNLFWDVLKKLIL